LTLAEDDLERVDRLVDFQELATVVRKAVLALPPSQGDALLLRVGEGMSYREVADRLGCTEGAARVRVTRGLSALSDRLGVL
jgi:RNA polymerase sigma-70 factor (ECF subfamily)